ncbi:hypothetical protein [Sarcina ventriculi]|uniref:hypothetical protein n=1 Tax=Sarcina ventriculi TaxID=1267 RepID=UPI0018ABEFE8|nr:hypothetical protein [Sarcina ventriculi]
MYKFINDLIENYAWYLSKYNELKLSNKNSWIKNFIRENNNISLNYNLINMKNKYKDFHNESHYENMLDIKKLIENNNFNIVEVKIQSEMEKLTRKNNTIKM